MNRIWIKLYLEVLDDPKMGLLPDRLWRRVIELFLLAGRNGSDGRLPPLMDMVWCLRTTLEELCESLRELGDKGIVHESTEGWMVTHFQERQSALTSAERVAEFRKRNRNGGVTEDVTKSYKVEVSDSTSTSTSESMEEEGVGGETIFPQTPVQAKRCPEIQMYERLTGRFPGDREYQIIIETIQYLRKQHGESLEDFLTPYWTAWSTRRAQDGVLYSKKSLVWLCEWAMQGEIPRANGHEPGRSWSPIPGVEETKKMLDEKWDPLTTGKGARELSERMKKSEQ